MHSENKSELKWLQSEAVLENATTLEGGAELHNMKKLKGRSSFGFPFFSVTSVSGNQGAGRMTFETKGGRENSLK